MKIITTILFVLLLSLVNAQTLQWVQNGGGASFDGSYSVCVDAQGNSYVAGRFTGTADFSGNLITSYGLQDGYLAKYDPVGNLIWVNHFGGLSMDLCSAICLDNNGQIIIAGQFAGTSTFGTITLVSNSSSYDCFVAKYDISGNCLWALKGGSAASYDNISGIAINASNDIFIVGWLSPGATLDWYTAPATGIAITFVAKIRSTGNLIWLTLSCQHNSGSMPLYALKVALDAAGNVFINANYSGNCTINGSPIVASGLQDSYIQKLDFSGNIVWTRIISGLNDDATFGIATDNSGNIIASGYYNGTTSFGGVLKNSNANSQDIFLAKFNSLGAVVWVQTFGGPNSDYAGSVTLKPNNEIVFAASFLSATQIGLFPFISNGGIDGLVICTNASGIPIWVIKAGGPGTDQAIGITEKAGEIFCSGIFNATANFNGITATSNGNGDSFLTKITTGTPLPVELISFSATADIQNEVINCKWTTASEINNHFFTLEKSIDGKIFKHVAQLDALSANSVYNTYSFSDENPFNGISYYRLSQTDFNGMNEILKTVAVNFKNKKTFHVDCNPSAGSGLINIASNKSIDEIKVFAVNGNLIREIFAASPNVFLNLSDLQKGTYFIRFKADEEVYTQKIMIR